MINRELLDKITYLAGNSDVVCQMPGVPAKAPFSDEISVFLSDLSKILMADKRSRAYSDVVTFAFWIRAASLKRMKEKYGFNDGYIHLGRGIAFHIAPSNVPVNFAYSLVSGLLTGNTNIVRIPSKEFPQVGIIVDAINDSIGMHEEFQRYIVLVRYNRDKVINDAISSIADTRIIWGGDRTIEELRASSLPPRSTEITFAARYSLAIIDSDVYMDIKNKEKVAQDFYNDTYFTDQNACTSPRVVIWSGKRKEEAKTVFWKKLHELAEEKYNYQDIQGVNKLTSCYLLGCNGTYGAKLVSYEDNLLIRVSVERVDSHLMDYMGNSGFFFEFNCDDVMELYDICNDKRCQTIGLIGNKEWLMPLVKSGIKGVDRIVPVGKTMDFDLVWDGYNLVNVLTRVIKL